MIKYVDYIESNGSQAGWILDGSMTASTDVLYFDFMPLSGNLNYDAFWFFLDKNSCYGIRCNVYDRTSIGFSKGNSNQSFNITYGERYNVVFGSAVTINGDVLIANAANPLNNNPLCVNMWWDGSNETPPNFRAQRARYYGVKLTDSNGSVLREWKPCINDDNNSVGFYETVTQTYVAQTGSGTTSIGPYSSTIIVSSDIKAVPASGGTINVTISTDTPLSATSTGSWYTMSQTEGTENDTAITITVPSTTAATQAEDIITFTNENGDTDQLAIKQRKYSAGGIRLIDLGASEVETFYIGGEQVEVIYMGEEVVYQAGEFIGLKMKSDVSIAMASGSTYNLKIKSSEPWTLSVDTAVTWLEFSQLTGGTGETIVTITTTEENQTGSDRSTTITATTANYTATCVVKQISIHYVEYIHKTTLSNNANDSYIDTLIVPTTATTFRVQGMTKGYSQGNTIVGYQDNDSKDYRLFWYSTNGRNLCFDFNNERLENSNWGGATNGKLIDITCNNYSVTSGDSQTPIMTGTTQSSIQDPHTIKIDVGTWWFKSLQIWEGQTLVFDGQAAVDDANNIIGIYDNVSNGWFYNSNLSMAYEENDVSVTWTNTGNVYTANVSVVGMVDNFHVCQLKDTYVPSAFQSFTKYYDVYLSTNNKVIVKRHDIPTVVTVATLGSNESYTNNYGFTVTNQMFINQILVEAVDGVYDGVSHEWSWKYMA